MCECSSQLQTEVEQEEQSSNSVNQIIQNDVYRGSLLCVQAMVHEHNSAW